MARVCHWREPFRLRDLSSRTKNDTHLFIGVHLATIAYCHLSDMMFSMYQQLRNAISSLDVTSHNRPFQVVWLFKPDEDCHEG